MKRDDIKQFHPPRQAFRTLVHKDGQYHDGILLSQPFDLRPEQKEPTMKYVELERVRTIVRSFIPSSYDVIIKTLEECPDFLRDIPDHTGSVNVLTEPSDNPEIVKLWTALDAQVARIESVLDGVIKTQNISQGRVATLEDRTDTNVQHLNKLQSELQTIWERMALIKEHFRSLAANL